MVVQKKEDRKDISAQSGTWFRNTSEWMGAAYTLWAQLSGHNTGTKAVREQRQSWGNHNGALLAMILWAKGVTELSVYNAWSLLHWAATFGPTKHNLHIQVLNVAWMGTAAGRAPTLLLSVLLLTQQNATSGGQQGSNSMWCSVYARSVCWVQLRQKLPLFLYHCCCLPARCTLLPSPSPTCSAHPTVGYIWRSAHPPHHRILFPKICSCFGGRWALPS